MMENALTTDPQALALVLQDAAGDYYLVPQEQLQALRVSAQDKAAITALVGEQTEVKGYAGPEGLLHLTVPAVIITGGWLIYDRNFRYPNGDSVLAGVREGVKGYR